MDELTKWVEEAERELLTRRTISESACMKIYVSLGYERRCMLARILIASVIPLWQQVCEPKGVYYDSSLSSRMPGSYCNEELPYVCLFVAKGVSSGTASLSHANLLGKLISSKEVSPETMLSAFVKRTRPYQALRYFDFNRLTAKYPFFQDLPYHLWKPSPYSMNCLLDTMAASLAMIEAGAGVLLRDLEIEPDPTSNAVNAFSSVKAYDSFDRNKDMEELFFRWWLMEAVPNANNMVGKLRRLYE